MAISKNTRGVRRIRISELVFANYKRIAALVVEQQFVEWTVGTHVCLAAESRAKHAESAASRWDRHAIKRPNPIRSN